MSVELKLCPFCGGTAHIEQPGTRRQSCVVECDSCGIRHESGDEGGMCGTAWNRREGEAARIQQQALEYVSLQAQCDEHLTRVSRLEILLDSERATNKALSDENAVLADRQPQELLARVAELEKERDALKVAEAAAIERCAKACDEWQRQYVLEQCCDVAQDNALKSVAVDIRALLPKEES